MHQLIWRYILRWRRSSVRWSSAVHLQACPQLGQYPLSWSDVPELPRSCGKQQPHQTPLLENNNKFSMPLYHIWMSIIIPTWIKEGRIHWPGCNGVHHDITRHQFLCCRLSKVVYRWPFQSKRNIIRKFCLVLYWIVNLLGTLFYVFQKFVVLRMWLYHYIAKVDNTHLVRGVERSESSKPINKYDTLMIRMHWPDDR